MTNYGLSPLEYNLLDVAIRSVYEQAARAGDPPRERMLRAELRERAAVEEAGAEEVASVLRTLAERLTSFCEDGSHAYLMDRLTTVPGDAPLVAFDTRKVPRELSPAVLFCLAEHVSTKLEQRQRARLEREVGGTFSGRSLLIVDEAWKLVERRATGEWVNDLARRARHLGLFLIAISQQLSDFAGEYGKALIRNSTMQLFLRQSPEELAYVQDALRLSDEEIRAIARLKTVKRSYSQAYWINGTRGRGTVALRVGPREYWLATSDPINDAPLRAKALRQAAGDPWAALEALAGERLEAHERWEGPPAGGAAVSADVLGRGRRERRQRVPADGGARGRDELRALEPPRRQERRQLGRLLRWADAVLHRRRRLAGAGRPRHDVGGLPRRLPDGAPAAPQLVSEPLHTARARAAERL